MDYVNGQMSMYNDRFAYSTCGGVHESKHSTSIDNTYSSKFMKFYMC